MKRAYRKPGALGVVMGILAGMVFAIGFMPRSVMAHSNHQATLSAGLKGAVYNVHFDRVMPFVCVIIADSIDSAHVDPTHRHSNYLRVSTAAGDTSRVTVTGTGKNPEAYPLTYLERDSLDWQTTYILQYMLRISGSFVDVGSPITVNTGAKPPGIESDLYRFCNDGTPTTPEPPTEPEPETPTIPDPENRECTYKHRLIGVPGTTGAGYTSQILIGSEASNATATITAYQSDNGHQIDVLDSEGSAIGSSVSLAPAHSVKKFSLEAIRGWHIVIVEHPSKAAMDNATVAMRLREPDTGISIVPAQGIEHCTNTATPAE